MVEDGLIREYWNYNPENDPSGAYGISLTDRVIQRYGSIENVPKLIDKKDERIKNVNVIKRGKDGELEKKLEFIRRVDEMGINPDSIFLNRDVKKGLIRQYKGYTKLNREGQNHRKNENGEYLSHCSDAKIGLVFRDIYRSFSKEVKK